MAENQKNPTGSRGQEGRNQERSSRISSDAREGKVSGSPSNVKNEDTEMSKRNKEGHPDESRIQGDKTRRSESDLNRSGRDSDNVRRNGGSL